MSMLTVEQTVDEIRQIIGAHVATMKERATASYLSSCVYRKNQCNVSPTRCLIGSLIADEHYDPMIENQTVTSIRVQACIRRSHPKWDLSDGVVTWLNHIQMAHDDPADDNTIENVRRRVFGILGTWPIDIKRVS